jgi:hypothetical protein
LTFLSEESDGEPNTAEPAMFDFLLIWELVDAKLDEISSPFLKDGSNH